MKSIKIRYDKLKKENVDYSILDEAVKNVNRLIHTNYLFIRSFLIYSFENNYDDMNIDVQFIRSGFRIVTGNCLQEKPRGRPTEKDGIDTLTKMKKYWTIFSKKTNIKPIICHNVSYMYNNSASEMYTNIINNLLGHFQKHIYKCIKSHYGMNYCKPNKIFSIIIKDMSEIIINKSLVSIKKKDESHRNMIMNRVKLFSDKFLPRSAYADSLRSANKFAFNNNFIIVKIQFNSGLCPPNEVSEAKPWHGKPLYKFNNCVFNNEIQINGYSVILNFIHKNGLDGQQKKKKSISDGRKESFKKKQELSNNEYTIYKTNKSTNKIEKKIQNSKDSSEKKKKGKKIYKKLLVEDKIKELYEIELKKEYPHIEYLIRGNDIFSKELREKYNSGKLLICDPGKNNLLYCYSIK